MKHKLIHSIEQKMLKHLNNQQLKELDKILNEELANIQIIGELFYNKDKDFVNFFISSKRLEGCSDKTLNYYYKTIKTMLNTIGNQPDKISTNELRDYLTNYQSNNKVSKTTIDNVRRIFSSFFSWLEDENYIIKSPVRRIKKIKTDKVLKDTYNDEELEIMRDNCHEIRDLAIIDLLASSGMRIGELVNLNINDINFNERECVVLGKGNKERKVYFDARAKLHIIEYLNKRNDNNKALFISLKKPYNRIKIGGIELRLREIGKMLKISNVYPHKFRRTMATNAIDKGMPIEQVQQLLGHQKIDTTLQYAMVKQQNVKNAHKKFIG